MDDKTITSIVSVLLAITGLAVLALLVSNSANTSNVFGAFGKTISQMLCVALKPINGGDCGTNTSSSITFGGQVPNRLF